MRTVLEITVDDREVVHAAARDQVEACDGDCDAHRAACGVQIFYPAPFGNQPVTCPSCLQAAP